MLSINGSPYSVNGFFARLKMYRYIVFQAVLVNMRLLYALGILDFARLLKAAKKAVSKCPQPFKLFEMLLVHFEQPAMFIFGTAVANIV